MEETIRVCLDFRMSMGQWDIAENCITTSITKKAYEEITQELKCNCWTTAMECKAGQQVTAMLKALVKLQGYKRLESWGIRLETVPLNSIPAGETMSKKEFEAVAVGSLAPKSVFTYGGVNWLVLQRRSGGVLCLAEKILFEKAFDKSDYNNWEESSLRGFLNNDFLEELVKAGAAETAFLPMITDLTADDGLKDYGSCEDIISLISYKQYLQHRGVITNADDWWWTCTPCSTKASSSRSVRYALSGGILSISYACNGDRGVRPLCTLAQATMVTR